MSLLFGTDGVRGRAGEYPLDHETVARIGAALVRHATEEARKLGCYKIILNCFENRIPFYKGLGFKPHDVGMRNDL